MISQHKQIRWTLGVLAIFGILNYALKSAGAPREGQNASDPRRAMVAELSASDPHPSLGEQAQVFDRLVGTWDCDFGFIAEDGSVRHVAGELRFGWIIDGRALQDIWITYPNPGSKERGVGTSIRIFDSQTKLWRVVFVSPAYNAIILVQGGLEGDRIVLRGVDQEGASLRWSFNNIQANSFI